MEEQTKQKLKQTLLNAFIHISVILLIVATISVVLKEMTRDFEICKDKPKDYLIMLPDRSTISCGELLAINITHASQLKNMMWAS